MKVHVNLFSILRDCLPPGATRGEATVELSEGARLVDLIVHLGIDRRLRRPAQSLSVGAGWQVLVNGQFESEMGRALADGDQVQIFPPVAGG